MQTTGKVPSLVGFTVVSVVMPWTASCFIRHSGTQNEWMTSLEVISKRIVWSIGTHELARRQRLAALDLDVGVGERPGELLRR